MTQREAILEMTIMLDKYKNILSSYVYSSSGPSENQEYEKLPLFLKHSYIDVLHDIDNTICSVDFLNRLRAEYDESKRKI